MLFPKLRIYCLFSHCSSIAAELCCYDGCVLSMHDKQHIPHIKSNNHSILFEFDFGNMPKPLLKSSSWADEKFSVPVIL